MKYLYLLFLLTISSCCFKDHSLEEVPHCLRFVEDHRQTISIYSKGVVDGKRSCQPPREYYLNSEGGIQERFKDNPSDKKLKLIGCEIYERHLNKVGLKAPRNVWRFCQQNFGENK